MPLDAPMSHLIGVVSTVVMAKAAPCRVRVHVCRLRCRCSIVGGGCMSSRSRCLAQALPGITKYLEVLKNPAFDPRSRPPPAAKSAADFRSLSYLRDLFQYRAVVGVYDSVKRLQVWCLFLIALSLSLPRSPSVLSIMLSFTRAHG